MHSRFGFVHTLGLSACLVAVGLRLVAQIPSVTPGTAVNTNSTVQLNERPQPVTPGSPAIAMSPPSVTLQAGQSEQFRASVESDNSAMPVTWSLTPTVGTISPDGLYAAPSNIATEVTVRLTATAVGGPARSNFALIKLRPSSSLVLGTFQMSELFGTSWPDQPIEFRYDGGRPPENATRMILEPAATEVPYQWVSSCSDSTATKGCIMVRSNLPPNANYTWTLRSGTAPTAIVKNPVILSRQGPNYEMTNGLTGIRIVTPASNPRPWNLAPIQGILLPNGVWTGAGSSPNLLYSESLVDAGKVKALLHTPGYTVTGYNVALTDSGPLKTVMHITYTFNRPQYSYGAKVVNTAGPGHYTLIVTMYANSKSILIDEDSDMQFSYYLPLYAQLMPDQARFRGHDVLSTGAVPNPICGYEALVPVGGASNSSPIVISAPYRLDNGQMVLISGVGGNTAANGTYYAKTSGYAASQFGLYMDAALITPVAGSGAYNGGGSIRPAYRGWTLHPSQDAYLDLTYTANRPASDVCTASTYRKLVTNLPPADHAAGWYVEMYQSTAGNNAPVVGIYTGRTSKLLYSDWGPSMPGVYTSDRHWISGKWDAGIQVDNLFGTGNNTSPVIHRNWGIWVSTKADLLPTASHQPIADDQNSLASVNLSHLYSYQLAYPDPRGGWKWLYLQPNSARQLISWVRNGTSVCGSVTCYYDLLYKSDPSNVGHSLLNMWRGNSTAVVQAALNSALAVGRRITGVLAAGDNHWDQPLEYYQIGGLTMPLTSLLNAILIDSNSTAAQKSLAKAMLALFGCILWDNDWFPIDNQTGGGTGLSNQYEAYLEFRAEAASAAPAQPYLASKLPAAINYTVDDFNQYFSPTGAVAASTHYQSAFFEPLILNYQPLALNGYLSMRDPKWAAYANWELSIQTPPEPRFGNVRKQYSNGDGNTEADVRTGLLAGALNPVNPRLASNLMWAWQQSNTPSLLTLNLIYSIGLAFIDLTIPAVAPQLGSINIPGYHSVERHGFATPNETVAWFINGDFYNIGGHRHFDDGQVSIYAHSAPLAIDWNANLYSPQIPGRFMHDSIVYDSELKHPWNADNAGLMDAFTLMNNPTNTEFGAFANSTTATAVFTAADGTVWTRMVRSMAFDLSYPIIYVADTFAGPGAGAGKTLTWNLMASGPVSTPAGWITPIARFSTGCQNPAGALPSNGTVNSLGSGLQAFSFTGAAWPKHATGGIDWDLFTLSNTTTQQFFIGNWGHGCNPGREAGEYQAANESRFAEIQHILRIHDTGPFTTIILPYRKTEPPTRTITQQSCGVQIVQGTETTCFNPSGARYTNGARSILTAYDGSAQSAFGVTVSGGPQEVAIQAGRIVWTISGVTAGARGLTLAGAWYPSQSVSHTGGTFTYSFPGGPQTTPVSIVFTQTPY
jgi:hypothetical protein